MYYIPCQWSINKVCQLTTREHANNSKHLDRNLCLFCSHLLCWLGARDGIVELRKNGTPHRKMTLPEDLRSIPTEFSSLILFLEVVGPCSLHLGDFTEPRSLSHTRPSPWPPSGLNNQARHYVFLQPSNSQFACQWECHELMAKPVHCVFLSEGPVVDELFWFWRALSLAL